MKTRSFVALGWFDSLSLPLGSQRRCNASPDTHSRNRDWDRHGLFHYHGDESRARIIVVAVEVTDISQTTLVITAAQLHAHHPGPVSQVCLHCVL
jgi:hypothetical protein